LEIKFTNGLSNLVLPPIKGVSVSRASNTCLVILQN